MAVWTREAVTGALGGEAGAVRLLVDTLAPIIQLRVGKALLRWKASAHGRNLRQEVEDLTQEIFASLFAERGKTLRAWEPSRGLSLENFVGFLAERHVASVLRNGKRSPWTEDPTLQEELNVSAGTIEGPEIPVASRELLSSLLLRLRTELSPRGMELFHLLLVEEQPVPVVCAQTQMSVDAVYAWRSRLGKTVRRLLAEMMAEGDTSERSGTQHTSQKEGGT